MNLILLNDKDVYGNVSDRQTSKRKMPLSISRMASRCNTAVQSQTASKPQSHLSVASTPRHAMLRSGTSSPLLDLNKDDDSDSDDNKNKPNFQEDDQTNTNTS